MVPQNKIGGVGGVSLYMGGEGGPSVLTGAIELNGGVLPVLGGVPLYGGVP